MANWDVTLGGSINGLFQIMGTGLIRASESIGFRFHTMDDGDTVIDVIDQVNGYIKVAGAFIDVKLSVESILLDEDSGSTIAFSDRQSFGSYLTTTPASTNNNMEATSSRSLNERANPRGP